MADISISKSRGKKYLGGASPMVPAFIVGDDPIPLNPPGTVLTTLYKLLGDVTDSSFVGKNGFIPVVVGENVLTLQSLTTNVLSTPLTGYVVGANTAISASNTILTAFQQVQGQINARVSGTIASGQVAFGTGVNTVGGENALWWDSTNDMFGIGTNSPMDLIDVRKNTLGGSGGRILVNNQAAASTGNMADIGFKVNSNFTPTFYSARIANINTTGAFSDLVFFIYDGGTNSGNEKVRILNNGNVGIGISNPQAKLSVLGAVGNSSSFRVFATGVGGVLIGFAGNDIQGRTSADTNGNLILQQFGGNLGVGTNNPTNLLDINGTARIRTISNGTGDFLTKSATGVITSRTAGEVRTDISAMPDQAIERASDTVIFDNDYIIGNAASRTGNILFDFTGAKLGSVTRMIHNSGTKPTIPATSILLSGSYSLSVNNYIWFVITKTSATQIVEVTISQVKTW